MFAALRRWCGSGRLAVFTTQVRAGCDLAVYARWAAPSGGCPASGGPRRDPEAVAVKLMWALGRPRTGKKAARLFETPIEYDIM